MDLGGQGPPNDPGFPHPDPVRMAQPWQCPSPRVTEGNGQGEAGREGEARGSRPHRKGTVGGLRCPSK